MDPVEVVSPAREYCNQAYQFGPYSGIVLRVTGDPRPVLEDVARVACGALNVRWLCVCACVRLFCMLRQLNMV